MADPFPDYDVLARRGTPSWNSKTREVVDGRLALAERDDVLSGAQLATLRAVAERIVPQPEGRAPVNVIAMLLDKIAKGDGGDGYRHADLPPALEAWQRGLDAIDAEAEARFDTHFAALDGGEADAVLRSIEQEETQSEAWADMPPKTFWAWRLIPDLVSAHWAHPSAWSAMGFGGPAGPRGYVRLGTDRRDPWEAQEQDDG